ncbi:MAG: beta-ketoacyl-ACP synthase III [Bacteroidales bacterium]|nr:beta-ketoacyl-ACP synthase III [Bacteroidales bacterium]
MSVYINNIKKFLPGEGISNDEMESYLGKIQNIKSKARPIVLRNNGIKNRYYAINKNQESQYSNAELTAEAIKQLESENFKIADTELLACGTSGPDQLLPSHASMVHGILATPQTEYSSFSGSCNSGMLAMKYAFMSILSGNTTNAVCTGSEKTSTWLTAKNFEDEVEKLHQLEEKPILAFSKEFLRWMLSDGAGAALLSDKPNTDSISLEINWIEITSYAGELETCMYAGAEKDVNGKIIPWRDFTDHKIAQNSIMTLKQDTRMLGEHIVQLGADYLKKVIKKRKFDINKINWFLPHLSSMYFKSKINEEMVNNGIVIPEKKWFLNLPKVGNVGSASAYLMLEELFHSGKLKKDQKILLMVPESSRFSYTYTLFTVV